jgi:hypothetical protein
MSRLWCLRSCTGNRSSNPRLASLIYTSSGVNAFYNNGKCQRVGLFVRVPVLGSRGRDYDYEFGLCAGV